MQINYDYMEERRASASGFYNAPDVQNTAENMDVPPVYSPYGTPTWWPDGSTPPAPPQGTIAPNSGKNVTVANSMSGLGGDPIVNVVPVAPGKLLSYYDPTVNTVPSQPPALMPQTLIAPMPQIVQPAVPCTTPDANCKVSSWVSSNMGLAILAALGVFALAAGGRK
jgi:hypothetical protein